MKVEFTRDGEHLVIDPETESFFRAFDLHETHAGYHTICRSVYAADKGDLPIVVANRLVRPCFEAAGVEPARRRR